MGLLYKFSLKSRKLRQRFLVSAALMSAIPILIILYLCFNYIFQETSNVLPLSIIFLLTAWIAYMGFTITRRIVNPMVDLAFKSRDIANGHYTHDLKNDDDDEIGEVVRSINMMKNQISGYIHELQEYNKKTTVLNYQVKRKMKSLANLMELSDLISVGSDVTELLAFASEKLAHEMENGFTGIFLRKENGVYSSSCFINKSRTEVSVHKIQEKLPIVEDYCHNGGKFVAVDGKTTSGPMAWDLRESLGGCNVMMVPLMHGVNILGAIVLGNFEEGHVFSEEDIKVILAYERLLVIGHQTAMMLGSKMEGVIDPVTGLYTQPYLETKLDEEINRAAYYQRPCSLAVLKIDNFEALSKVYGEVKTEQVLRQVTKVIFGSISPISKAARMGFGEFGFILPEKNKRESMMIAENIKKQIESMQVSDDPSDKITVSVGIGENPLDGSKGKELVIVANKHLESAIESGGSKVVGY